MNQATVRIGDQFVGDGHPVFIVAEIGINHNGSLDLARRLIDGAVLAGADAVKFQKRTPEICVPRDQWDVMRETPWGPMTYIDYRHKLEFGFDEYAAIDRHASYYRCPVERQSRSVMNVVFRLPTEADEERFVAEAKSKGMVGLKGHRSVGGIRASIYNAVQPEWVEALAQFMGDFAKRG